MKRNLLFRLFLSVVALFSVSLLTSCEPQEGADEGTASLAVSATTLLFDADGAPADDNAGVLEIESNRDWTVVIPEAAAEWLTVSPMSGKGNGKVTFSMPATNVAREATLSVEVSNAGSVLAEESVVVKQEGDGTVDPGTDPEVDPEVTPETPDTVVEVESVMFDGSEFTAEYTENATISKGDVDFVVNLVANYTEKYPDSAGRLQFKAGGSSMYNTVGLKDLRSIVIMLRPEGTEYNNFEVYAGTTVNPEGDMIEGVREGDICTYTVPAGSTCFSIENNSTHASYAHNIEILCGDTESSLGDGTVDPGTDPEVGDEVSIVLAGGNDMPESSATGKFEVEGASFAYYEACYNSYGSYSIPSGNGYICNETELNGLSKIVITEDYQYYNFTLYVGTEVNPRAEKVEYTKEGDDYIYTISEGSKYFAIVNESTYAASGDQIKIVYESLGETSTITPPVADENTIYAVDFGVADTEDLETITFGDFTFSFDAGTHSSGLAPKYYESNKTLRWYKGNTVTVKGDVDITEIVFDFAKGSKMTASAGTYDSETKTWTGSEKEVTFTIEESIQVRSILIN